MRFGSVKRKENSISLLLRLCKEDGEVVARRLFANLRSIPSLQNFAADGSLRVRRCSSNMDWNMLFNYYISVNLHDPATKLLSKLKDHDLRK